MALRARYSGVQVCLFAEGKSSGGSLRRTGHRRERCAHAAPTTRSRQLTAIVADNRFEAECTAQPRNPCLSLSPQISLIAWTIPANAVHSLTRPRDRDIVRNLRVCRPLPVQPPTDASALTRSFRSDGSGNRGGRGKRAVHFVKNPGQRVLCRIAKRRVMVMARGRTRARTRGQPGKSALIGI